MQSMWNDRIKIEGMIYKRGINVALKHAEKSKTYTKFKTDLTHAIAKQIGVISSSPEKIDSLLLLAKTENALLKQVEVFLEKFSVGNEINLQVFLIWAGTQGGQAAMDKLGIQGVFNLKNPEIIKFFGDYSNLRIDTVDDTTKKWIAAKIQEGKDNQLSPKDIAQTLIDEGKGISQQRAETIAVTETSQALVKVETQAAASYGITEKVWRTSLDDRVDEICIGLEGAVADIEGEFDGGYYGGDAHPNCRCYIEEVVPEGWQVPDDPWTGE